MTTVRKVIFLGKDIIAENAKLAENLRKLYDKTGVKVLEVLGGPGSGKTLLIERLIDYYKNELGADKIAYIGGDVATTLDSERILKHGVKVVQVNTGGTCHLEVPHIEKAIEALGGPEALGNFKLLIIENVGNIICPFNFPLGAHIRLMVADVCEGEDKFIKHPLSTRVSDVIVINKIDIAEALNINLEKMIEDARKINPNAPIFTVSSKTGQSIDKLSKELKKLLNI